MITAEEEAILSNATEETPALRRYRRLLRRREVLQRQQQAEEATKKLKCLFCLLLISSVLALFAPNSLPIELLLCVSTFPVMVGLMLIKMTAPAMPVEDEEGEALVVERTKEEVLEALIKIPVDTDMAGVECDICQEEYVRGDVMAASPNPDCAHMFHQHCIAAWLINHDLCPICRRNYMERDKKEKKQDEETAGDIELGELNYSENASPNPATEDQTSTGNQASTENNDAVMAGNSAPASTSDS